MTAEWQPIPFERLLSEPVRNGLYKPKPFHGRGAKIVNMGELFAYPRLRAVPMKRVEISRSETERFTLSKGDLLFARRSLVAEGAGKCSIVLDVDEPTTFESSIIRARPNSAKTEPLFLYYFFNSTAGLHCLDTIRRQVAVAGITGSDLSRLEIPIPPLPVQRAIAHILGTLDDKIELNRRTNETLEAMARAIFKSWFVDFDPVRAKAEGRDASLPKHIADLFPDCFEDSELGEIPAGWKVGNVAGFASLSRNGINPGDFPDETFEYFSLPAFDAGQTPKPELGRAIKSNKYLIPPDAVLLSKLNPRIPRLWLPVVSENRRAISSTEFLLVSPRAEASREFIYGFLSSEAFADVFETLVTGTSGSHQRVKPEGLLSMNIVVPGKSVIHHFSKVVQPLLARTDRAREESQTLAAFRDALLPKLVSGELRVTDVGPLITESLSASTRESG